METLARAEHCLQTAFVRARPCSIGFGFQRMLVFGARPVETGSPRHHEGTMIREHVEETCGSRRMRANNCSVGLAAQLWRVQWKRPLFDVLRGAGPFAFGVRSVETHLYISSSLVGPIV